MVTTTRPARTGTRVLLLDGSPGSTTVLILAAHQVITGFDYVLAVDTGAYPAAVYEYLDRARALTHQAGAEFLRTDATGIADRIWSEQPCPLPLFTRQDTGKQARLPNRCRDSQLLALTRCLHRWAAQLPGDAVLECVLGLGAEHTHRVPTQGTDWLGLDYPLFAIGWSERNCLAFNHHYGLGGMRGLACLACPERSDAAWVELRDSDRQAWQEALAVDTAIRHKATAATPGGMPPGATGYLHRCRMPLAEVELNSEADTAVQGCLPRAYRGEAAPGGGHP